ncbi:hypothetical protein ElyMa_004951000 [Elysia marginata]|uniref:RRM domain-containing protein n=1 Tax=Elysia marginata TaxID=1093978 RepID=A0AAV4J192_9GAST|nr:hypothetical protein ElyMa_004951000 [Elysia marginata]
MQQGWMSEQETATVVFAYSMFSDDDVPDLMVNAHTVPEVDKIYTVKRMRIYKSGRVSFGSITDADRTQYVRGLNGTNFLARPKGCANSVVVHSKREAVKCGVCLRTPKHKSTKKYFEAWGI